MLAEPAGAEGPAADYGGAGGRRWLFSRAGRVDERVTICPQDECGCSTWAPCSARRSRVPPSTAAPARCSAAAEARCAAWPRERCTWSASPRRGRCRRHVRPMGPARPATGGRRRQPLEVELASNGVIAGAVRDVRAGRAPRAGWNCSHPARKEPAARARRRAGGGPTTATACWSGRARGRRHHDDLRVPAQTPRLVSTCDVRRR